MDSIWCDIEGAREDILDNPMYIILNLCRVLGYKEEGLILSKKEGGEWMLGKLAEEDGSVRTAWECADLEEGIYAELVSEPVDFTQLIRGALEEYATGQKMELQEALAKQFAEEMLKKISSK